ncbi:hypothetical protein [Stigmatella aurantiaca]|uniref:Uncharacterized protein n=1 Tax=Stigmatella aurantiaca (strain DW4/3-1) TaxID=378806 RepID=Q08PZ0_STIAD|nr:hypothetical protein [Stigmatella aurantiaca]ADO69840.1 uncharacterized protein STAUR_2036 [Stigmatella aurantiaca DW4/3-1]EAU62546.1 hypothetical protein STIAU_2322 [Stigmatella aurantiaca DW4/3-1]
MSIIFVNTWDNKNNFNEANRRTYSNHTSERSKEEVEEIIKEIPGLHLSADGPEGEMAMAVQMGFEIKVHKGIHPDSKDTMHILVEVQKKKYHLNLKKDEYRTESNGSRTFIWRIENITTGG